MVEGGGRYGVRARRDQEPPKLRGTVVPGSSSFFIGGEKVEKGVKVWNMVGVGLER